MGDKSPKVYFLKGLCVMLLCNQNGELEFGFEECLCPCDFTSLMLPFIIVFSGSHLLLHLLTTSVPGEFQLLL